jgi:hypothetical protein
MMDAFWRGEFALEGLTLWQSEHGIQGGRKYEDFTRFGLAEVALGQAEFKRRGPEAAIRHLLDWNLGDYEKIRAELRYYFLDREAKRGLCASRDTFESWWRESAKSVTEAGGRRINKISISNTSATTSGAAHPVSLEPQHGPPQPLPAQARYKFPEDRRVFDAVCELLAFDSDARVETTIRECAQNLSMWPEDDADQDRMIERIRKRVTAFRQKSGSN